MGVAKNWRGHQEKNCTQSKKVSEWSAVHDPAGRLSLTNKKSSIMTFASFNISQKRPISPKKDQFNKKGLPYERNVKK